MRPIKTPSNAFVLRWTLRAALLAVPAAGLAGLALNNALAEGWPGFLRTASAELVETSSRLGLTVRQVTVEGRRRTAAADILTALDADQGSPLLSFNPQNARDRLEKLPWVKSAAVARRFPTHLHVHLVERTPLALWQQGKSYTLIDAEGIAINDRSADFADLPLVVGDGAPEAASGLFVLLSAQPALKTRVKAAVRVGKRRWDLWLDEAGPEGIEVRLPENVSPDLLQRLAALERKGKLLSRNVAMIDLRLPDRIVVREAKAAPETGPRAKPGEKAGTAKSAAASPPPLPQKGQA